MRAVASPKSSSVDVAIVMYGGIEFLPACFDALEAQTHPVDRVFVIDNAASEHTARIAAERGAVLVRNDENLGYAAAMNQEVALSEAAFLLSLNADCVLDPGYVAACVAELDAQADAAAVTGVLRLPDGRIDSTGIALTPDGRAADRDRHRQSVTPGDPYGVSGAAALWRRAALDALGPDPWWAWLFVYWEDVEIAFRLRAKGWTFRCAIDATATHQRGSDTADPDFVESLSLRNRIATLARHRGITGVATPAASGRILVTAARLALRHPKALRRAEPITALRAGLAQRRADSFAL
jgi:GT2 family glycosyltransferase